MSQLRTSALKTPAPLGQNRNPGEPSKKFSQKALSRKVRSSNIPAGAQGMLQIIELRHLPADLREKYAGELGELYHRQWGEDDDGFRTPEEAKKSVLQRAFSGSETVFVAHLPSRKELAGGAAIGIGTDYYPTFGRENGIHPKAPIGRDLFVKPEFRSAAGEGSKGAPIKGIPVWKHLLAARMQRVVKALYVLAEDHALVRLYENNGAKVAQTHLKHRDNPELDLTLLKYGEGVAKELRREVSKSQNMV